MRSKLSSLGTGQRTAVRIIVMGAAALLVATASSASAQSYTTGLIEAPGVTKIIPLAVNNSGVVVGYAYFGNHYGAFRWEDGTLIELQLPGGAGGAVAIDINDDGVIVGNVGYSSTCFTGRSQGAFWTASKTTSSVTVLGYNLDHGGLPDEADCDFGSGAHGINSAGVIVGAAAMTQEGDQSYVPAISFGGGWSQFVEILTPGTGLRADGWAININDSGLVMGKGTFGPDRAFVSTGGGYQIIEINPDGYQGLNNLGHVVGRSAYDPATNIQVARLWDGESYIDLDSSNSQAFAVNDFDIAVGRRVGPDSFGLGYIYGIGMLYRPGASPGSLSSGASAGWKIEYPTDINNDGMIVGTGEYNDEDAAFWMVPAAPTFLLKGTVTEGGGAPVWGGTVKVARLSGDGEEALDPGTTDVHGRYSFHLSAGNYSVWVEPRGSFAPHAEAGCEIVDNSCRVVLDRAVTVDFVGPGVAAPVEFATAAFITNEALGTATVTVTRSFGSLAPATVDYVTSDGTANGGASCSPGVDYIQTGGTLSFPAGSISRSFTIPICNDAVIESDEFLTVTLSNPTGGAPLGSRASATLNITRSDEFANPAAITVPEVGPASTYPSQITVSGVQGLIDSVTVTLDSLQHFNSDHFNMLLVSPSGRSFNFLAEVGPRAFRGVVNITLSDTAAATLPGTGNTAIASGVYQPSVYFTDAVFPAPAPASGYQHAGPAGTGTFASAFGNTDPNGTWSLYVVDDTAGGAGGIYGGWSMAITTALPAPGQLRFESAEFAVDETAGEATITVRRSAGALGTVTVDYATSNGTATGGAACIAGVDFISSSGTLAFPDGVISRSFTVPICNDTLSESNESVILTLSNPTGGASIGNQASATLTIVQVAQFTNLSAITIPDSGAASIYPSDISVGGLEGVVATVTLTLNGIQHAYSSDLDMLLVSPSGQSFNFLSEIGDETGFDTRVTITLSDLAVPALPTDDVAIPSGSYRPAAYSLDAVFPAPAPASGYQFPRPTGNGTFTSIFSGTDPNGTWSLYVVDDTAEDAGSIEGGWSLSISTIPAPIDAKITSISTVGNAVHLQGEGRTNTVYGVQASSDLTTTFAPIGSAATNASGVFQYIDSTDLPRRFYRLMNP